MVELTWSGPADARHVVVFAPGDSGCVTDLGPALIAAGLARAGIRVVQFDMPPAGDSPGERDAVVAEAIREVVGHCSGHRLVLGGMSRGARVSTTLVDTVAPVGLLLFAYPFHDRRDPDPRGRDQQLAEVAVPVLLCQGTRDSRGNRQQVIGYRLPAHVRVHWLEDANHPLRPRPASGTTAAEQLGQATQLAAELMAGW